MLAFWRRSRSEEVRPQGEMQVAAKCELETVDMYSAVISSFSQKLPRENSFPRKLARVKSFRKKKKLRVELF